MTSRLLVLAVTSVAAIASLSVGADTRAPLLRAAASGDVQLRSSHNGEAVLTASRLRPGASAEGTLTLTNSASEAQRLTLATSGLVDTPGAGGGLLSRWLDLRVERDSLVVYSGKLADLDEVDLGELAPRSATPFRIVATLPERGPAVDGAYAGGVVEVAWSWHGAAHGDNRTEEGERPGAAIPAEPVAPPEPDVAPDEPAGPLIDELEGPAAAGSRTVRLWIGGRSRQRVGRALGLSAVCRPACTLSAVARVRIGGRWRLLGRRALGNLAARPQPTALGFRITARRERMLRAALRSGRPLRVRIAVTAAVPDHKPVTKIRTLRLLR